MTTGERRLAAIMFTDMAGYTSLSQRDEARAMQLLEEHRSLIRPLFLKHNGLEIKAMGDAFLVEFASALEAVRCAFDIQQSLHEFNSGSPAGRRVSLRIGIHLGDVVHSQNDVYGDTVNIASRIEPMAPAGGICVTEQVYVQIRNKFEFSLSSLGRKELKNVDGSTEVFRVVLPWEKEEGEGASRSGLEKNRIAVLPFANLSPNPADEYFADGMTEELITSLSGVRELTVIARTSVMKYKASAKGVSEIARELRVGTLIEGSIRKAGNRLRITAQLIDAATEGHIWVHSYDKELDDIFAIQSEIAEEVAKELRIQLIDSERSRLEKRPTDDKEAYLLYLKGRHYWNERSDEGLKKALAYFEQATRKDERFALGYVGLSDCHAVMARNDQAEFGPAFRRAKELAARALELDENLAEAHASMGGVLHYYDHDWRGAELEFRRALELKPNYSTAHQWYSHVLFPQRRFSEGERELAIALELDPFSLTINHNVGAGKYYRGQFDEAIKWFKRANEIDPGLLFASTGPVGLVQAYVRKGKYADAMHEVEAVERLPRRPRGLRLWRAYALAAMGEQAEARTVLDEVEADYKAQNISPYLIGLVHFILGDRDAGFRWLQTALAVHDGSIGWLAVDFELSEVRDDPRFVSLLGSVGLDGIALPSN